MNVSRYISPAAWLIAACVAVIGCDNGATDTVPSQESQDESAKSAPALEVPEEASETKSAEVVVWVNGDPLEKHQVDRQLRELRSLYGAQRRPLEGNELEVKRRLVTERLIDRRLLNQWLESRERPVVTSREIDDELTEQIQERFGSRDVLQRHLERRGATLNEFRSDLRRRLVLERMLAAGDSDPVDDGPDAGVQTTFENIVARPARQTRVRAASLFVPWPDAVPRQEVVDAVVSSATASKNLNEFQAAASDMQKKWNADFTADIGWTRKGETAGDVEQTLFGTGEGHATEAITTPLGVQIYFVIEREELDTPHFEEHRDAVEQHIREVEFMRRKKALVEKLRSTAVLRWNEPSEENQP